MYTVYEDDRGNLYRVSPGLTSGTSWMTVRVRIHGSGSQHRVVSKNLPIRDKQDEAQADLDIYAREKRFRRVGTVGGIS